MALVSLAVHGTVEYFGVCTACRWHQHSRKSFFCSETTAQKRRQQRTSFMSKQGAASQSGASIREPLSAAYPRCYLYTCFSCDLQIWQRSFASTGRSHAMRNHIIDNIQRLTAIPVICAAGARSSGGC
jgi:hypothetical protein